jgi:hypothetical protein
MKAKSERRKYIGDEIDECVDTSALYYGSPFEKVHM